MSKIKEILKANGIDNQTLVDEIDSYIDATLAKENENMIPQSRFSEKCKEVRELRADLAEAKDELESFKNDGSGEKISELQKTIDELKSKNESYETKEFNAL